VKSILQRFSLGEVWSEQGSEEILNVLKLLKDIMYIRYESDWAHLLCTETNSTNKLRTYKLFKTTFTMENYVLHITNTKIHQNFTALRISNHLLNIETGRYKRPKKTPVSERLCTMCSMGAVEDEQHFILDCAYYKTERSLFLNNLQSLLTIDNLSPSELFHLIMSCSNGDVEATDLVVVFVNACMKKKMATTTRSLTHEP